jgi:phage tail-like protein
VRASLVDQLPAPLAEDAFLRRFLGIFDELSQSVQMDVDGLGHVIDPTVAPPVFVRWLGGWLGIDSIDPSLPELRQRELVRAMGRFLWWRGTATGLQGMLEMVTGGPVEVTDGGGVHRRGEAPKGSRWARVTVDTTGPTTEEHLLALVRAEIPADIDFELHVGGRRVWPPRPRSRPNGPGGRTGGTRAPRGYDRREPVASARTEA